jgi:hypothetical protein
MCCPEGACPIGCVSERGRCSTDEQDLAVQRQAFLALGVAPDQFHIDHGMSGTKREL